MPPANLGLNPALILVSSKMSTDFKRGLVAPLVSFCILFSLLPIHTITFCICLHSLYVQVSQQVVNPPYLSTLYLLLHSPTEGKESTKLMTQNYS